MARQKKKPDNGCGCLGAFFVLLVLAMMVGNRGSGDLSRGQQYPPANKLAAPAPPLPVVEEKDYRIVKAEPVDEDPPVEQVKAPEKAIPAKPVEQPLPTPKQLAPSSIPSRFIESPPVKRSSPSTPARAPPPAPKPAVKEARKYWMNSKSGVRHNTRCRYFANTKSGYMCGPDDGKGCGICGG